MALPLIQKKSCVGIVGGGQLARMMAAAAVGLDVAVAVLAPDASAPAIAAGALHVPGDPDELEALRRLAEASDVVTFDHELVPPEHLRQLEQEGHSVQPPPGALVLAQDKAAQRRVLGGELGLPVPAHRSVATLEEVEEFATESGWPVVLKLARGGYDGRGVWIASGPEEAAEAFGAATRAGRSLLAEETVAIERELAVLVARSTSGESVVYPVAETLQVEGMCREIVAPAPVDEQIAAEARKLATTIADSIGATGIMAVELFLSAGRLSVNELALRPHNSGHYTLGGCVTSQFENHLRAVLGLPLGDASLIAPVAATTNVIGVDDSTDPAEHLASALAVPGALVQLYGKSPRPGRKLGHVTAFGDDLEDVRRRSRLAARRLEGSAS